MRRAEAPGQGRLVSRGTLTAGLIVLVALALRLPGLDRWPPAIHQDEASNVVDGWSLLSDGVDRAGRTWPVFLEGFGAGDNRTSLYAVLTIPGIALFGPGAFAARLPAALAGAWTVLALFLFARRVRGDRTAFWAAALLAANPWHVYLSRFGHEASITPAFLITALWLVSGAEAEGVSPADARRSVIRWGSAGLILAAGLYSYPSFRLFLPLILAAAFLFKAGPRSNRTSLALVAGVAVASIPLLVASLAHPDRLLGRAAATSVLGNVEPAGFALWVILRQYVRHFLPGFLFVHGDGNPLQSPPGGELLWVELPAIVLGVVAMARRRDRWDRFCLMWLLLYPLASAFTLGDRAEYVPHSLRAAVGLPLFQLIGGEGIASTFQAAARARRVRAAAWGIALAANLAVVAVLFTGGMTRTVAPRYHAAYPPAIRYLAAHPDRYGALVISGRGVQQAYIYAILYGLLTPGEYRREPKEIAESGAFHVVRRIGKIHFYYDPKDIPAIRSTLQGRVWTLAPPGEIRSGNVVARFPYAGGEPGLEVREIDL